MSRPPKLKHEQVRNVNEAVDRMQYISDYDQEVVLLITLSSDYRIIDEHIISIGATDQSPVDLKVLFNRVLTDKAQKFFMGHNHPNGLAAFSEEDVLLVAKMKCIAGFLGIDFLDSVLFPHGKKRVRMSRRHRSFWSIDFTEAAAEAIVDVI